MGEMVNARVDPKRKRERVELKGYRHVSAVIDTGVGPAPGAEGSTAGSGI